MNRTLRAYRNLIVQNLSRMADRANRLTVGLGGGVRAELVRQATIAAWWELNQFDPTVESWINFWTRRAERVLADGALDLTATDEDVLTAVFRSESRTPDYGHGYVRPLNFGVGVGAPLNLRALPRHAKDCPPCWRCRYFDGWLPEDDDEVRESGDAATDPEIKAACHRIDANKIRVAQWIRSQGWENFSADDEPLAAE